MRLGEPGPGRGELGRSGRRGGRVEPAAAAAAGGGGGAGGGGEPVLRRSGSSSRSSGAAAVVAPSPSSSSVRVCARVELRHDASRARTGDGHCSGSRGVRGSRRVQRGEVAAAARRARCSDAVPVVVASHVSCLAPCVVVVVALIRHSVVPALELAVGVVLLLVGGRGGRCFFFGGRCFFSFRC